MKSIVVLLVIVAICACSSFDARAFRKKLISSKVSPRQSSTVNCTTPTYIKAGQTCFDSEESNCEPNTYCTTTNGGSAYTCNALELSKSCKTSSDCLGGLPCTNGVCLFPVRLPGDTCSSDYDCQSFSCLSGKCSSLAAGESCSDSLQCAKGLFCNATYYGSSDDGVCTAQVAAGGNCLPYASAVDFDINCVAGYLCALDVSAEGYTAGTCKAVGSLGAGSSFGGDTSLCAASLYAQYNGDGAYTCVSSAPFCNNEDTCASGGSSQCQCPSSGTGNGTCGPISCASESSNLLKCVYNTGFGLNALLPTAYSFSGDTSSAIYSSCHSTYVSGICCVSQNNVYYLPSGYCSSSAIIAPAIVLIIGLVTLLV